ncbi:phosphotransferase enzyme family protein [Microlunatus elymi]|uniref:phosphotransferase enzyme family protein n=1 Tax=Microlunatus elymi TaxID=2596828 RepID=UPI00143DBC75|nr:phosphotransferase [Microlunatus elymi]
MLEVAERIASGSEVRDLGGHFSLNLHLREPGLVLRVHQPFVSRQRLLGLQAVRRHLASVGVQVAVAIPWEGKTVFRCADRWAELEPYIPHEAATPSADACTAVLSDLGTIDRHLATFTGQLTRPVIATWATGSALRRWLAATRDAVAADRDASHLVEQLVAQSRTVARRWVPARDLVCQVIHGDGKANNLPRTGAGELVALDFGFAARRPRVHDLAYSLNWAIAVLGPTATDQIPVWIKTFEAGTGSRLTSAELRALPVLGAAIALYRPAVSGYNPDPVNDLMNQTGSLQKAAWWLDQ